ncbi:nucleotide exchange factor GrpE, partial [Patescibacteria group bacterium]|nr:nucleotide exchange factor GrpE [Patescibacteria group bacterium]
LIGSLQKMGVERFGEQGETYDHYKHEALAQQGDGDTVKSVERSGYKVGEKIIRPAQVII